MLMVDYESEVHDLEKLKEFAMRSGHTVTTARHNVHVEVKLGTRLLAASDQPVLLDETGLPTRYYLPREDVRMELFRPTSFHTTCPFKGEASYWSIDIDGQTHDGIAWSYESPLDSVTDIREMISFYPNRAEVIVDGGRISA
jgi:uncharacterized protein (DUF427 family)